MNGNSNEYSLGFLAEITTTSNNVYYFQNFQREENFLNDDIEYIYIPFSYNPPPRNINLEGQNTSIILPNIPVIMAYLVANNYFRDAIIQVTEIQFDFPTVPAINLDLLTISNYQIVENAEDTQVSLTLETPFNILTGKFPNVYYMTGYKNSAVNVVGYVPEVPLFTKPNF